MTSTQTDGLVDRLSRFDRLVEVGIGRRTAVARGLTKRGCTVTATDVYERSVPGEIDFVLDDVTAPTASVYADADVVYALRCPPELHRPLRAVGRAADATVYFTTLGGEPPTVPVTPVTVPGTTLYRCEDRGSAGSP